MEKNIGKFVYLTLITTTALSLFSFHASNHELERAQASEETLIYEEDFSNALDSCWYAATGNNSSSSYEVSNGKLNFKSLSTITPVGLYNSRDIGNNYRVEADVTINSYYNLSRWVGIAVRVQETAGWFKGSIGLGNAVAINNFTKTNITSGGWNEYIKGSSMDAIELNHTYRLSITCYGNHISFGMDGNYLVDTYIPNDYATGGFGLVLSGLDVDFDNIKVYEALKEGPKIDTSKIIDTYVPNTGIVNPPIAITNDISEAKHDANVMLMQINEDGTVKIESGDTFQSIESFINFIPKSIPAFYIKSNAAANILLEYLNESELVEGFVVTDKDNTDLIDLIRQEHRIIRGVIYWGEAPENPDDAREIVATVNRADSNVVIIKNASFETTYYLQRRMITVWEEVDKVQDIYKALHHGVNGIIYKDVNSIYNVYSSITDRTVIRKPIISAHRGASSLWVENTFKAFVVAYEMGADAFETDLYLTQDNKIVLFHNGTLDGVTDASGSIESYTYEQLKKVNIISKANVREKIPLLEDVMKYFCDKDMVIMFEIKSSKPELMIELKRLIDKYDFADHVVIMSGNLSQIKRARDIIPEVSVSRGSFSDVINKKTIDKESIAAAIYDLSPNSYQPFPYWWNTPDNSWTYLYKLSCRGWLTWSSTCSTRYDCDMRSLYLYGTTSVLANNLEWAIDYIYRLDVEQRDMTLKQLSSLKGNLIGYDGTFETNCKYAVLTEDGMISNIKITNAGEYTILPYVDVTLPRNDYEDLSYRIYASPINIKIS